MSWILDFVPWWAWVIAAVIALVATYPMWSAIWLVLPRPVKIVLGAMVTIALAYLAGRNRGVANEKQRQKDADAQAVKRRLDTNAEVDNLSPADRDKRLDSWMRD